MNAFNTNRFFSYIFVLYYNYCEAGDEWWFLQYSKKSNNIFEIIWDGFSDSFIIEFHNNCSLHEIVFFYFHYKFSKLWFTAIKNGNGNRKKIKHSILFIKNDVYMYDISHKYKQINISSWILVCNCQTRSNYYICFCFAFVHPIQYTQFT